MRQESVLETVESSNREQISQEQGSCLTYWQQQLACNLPILELSTVAQPLSGSEYHLDRHAWLLDRSLTSALADLGDRHGADSFTLLLTVWNILLYRYTSQERIVIASDFPAILPLCTHLADNLSFTELLGRVRAVVQGAKTHQDLSLTESIEKDPPPRFCKLPQLVYQSLCSWSRNWCASAVFNRPPAKVKT